MNETMNTDGFIRSRARLNWSRKMVADALGIQYSKFLGMARLLPDVKWCANTESVEWQRSRETRRGVCTPGLRRSVTAARAERYKKAEKHNIAGVVGTVREIYEAWRTWISVSLCQVRRRLSKGVNVLDAFFKPNETHLGWGQNREYFRH